MIRIAVVDDHPALRAGLHTVLEAEPGLVFVAESAGDEESLWPMLHRTRPDLVLLDYHLPRGDGLQLCYRIKEHAPAPKVVLFSAYASPELAFPAALARADGLLPKGVGARELFNAIRAVDRGERLLPEISSTVLAESFEHVAPEHRPMVGMLLDGSSEAEVAEFLGTDRKDVRRAVHQILSRLSHNIPAAT
jgi:DNA-binding NarL/FixJ family response regulator